MIALAVRYWFVIVILALAALVGVQQLRVSNAKQELSAYKLEVSENARIAEQTARIESERMQRVFDEQAEEARKEKQQLEASFATLADSADGLRGELAAFRKRAAQNTCAPIGGKGKPSEDPIGMLAGLLERSSRTNQELAEFADRLKLAGLACEKSTDSLK